MTYFASELIIDIEPYVYLSIGHYPGDAIKTKGNAQTNIGKSSDIGIFNKGTELISDGQTTNELMHSI